MKQERVRWLFRCARSIPKIGLSGAFRLFVATFNTKKNYITPHGYSHPLLVRGCTSDAIVFYLIFVVGEYPLVTLPNVRWIVDAGANVGYFSVFAAHHYPMAKIVALEPEASNFEVLKYNTQHYPQITSIEAGLWGQDATLHVHKSTSSKWAYKVVPANDSNKKSHDSLKVLSLKTLMINHQIEAIDLLKMDIEGSEKEVFSAADTTWLHHVKILMIELHPGCWKTFFRALEPYLYDVRQVGENTVVILNELHNKSGILKLN